MGQGYKSKNPVPYGQAGTQALRTLQNSETNVTGSIPGGDTETLEDPQLFHANLITPYKETELHGPNFTRPPPDLVDREEEYKVEKIIDMKQMGQWRKTYYLVKWKGYPTSDNSWEPRENIHAEELIREFQKRNSKPRRKL